MFRLVTAIPDKCPLRRESRGGYTRVFEPASDSGQPVCSWCSILRVSLGTLDRSRLRYLVGGQILPPYIAVSTSTDIRTEGLGLRCPERNLLNGIKSKLYEY